MTSDNSAVMERLARAMSEAHLRSLADDFLLFEDDIRGYVERDWRGFLYLAEVAMGTLAAEALG